jgi:hypothetical protein
MSEKAKTKALTASARSARKLPPVGACPLNVKPRRLGTGGADGDGICSGQLTSEAGRSTDPRSGRPEAVRVVVPALETSAIRVNFVGASASKTARSSPEMGGSDSSSLEV